MNFFECEPQSARSVTEKSFLKQLLLSGLALCAPGLRVKLGCESTNNILNFVLSLIVLVIYRITKCIDS